MDTLMAEPRTKWDEQTVEFAVSSAAAALLDIPERFAIPVIPTEHGFTIRTERSTAEYLLNVTSAAINRRCQYAKDPVDRLSADECKTLEVFEAALRDAAHGPKIE